MSDRLAWLHTFRNYFASPSLDCSFYTHPDPVTDAPISISLTIATKIFLYSVSLQVQSRAVTTDKLITLVYSLQVKRKFVCAVDLILGYLTRLSCLNLIGYLHLTMTNRALSQLHVMIGTQTVCVCCIHFFLFTFTKEFKFLKNQLSQLYDLLGFQSLYCSRIIYSFAS